VVPICEWPSRSWTIFGWTPAASSSEIAIGTYQYSQTGDANAYQQQMGGVAAGNLAAAGMVKAGPMVTRRLSGVRSANPSGVRAANTNVVEEVVGGGGSEVAWRGIGS
jgi:hypothetical protein